MAHNSDLLLKREASLAAMSLGIGLTHIGKYNYAATGFFYSGLLSKKSAKHVTNMPESLTTTSEPL